jgi:hypothetical protein
VLIKESTQRRMLKALGGSARARTDKGHTDCIFDDQSVRQPADSGFEVAETSPQLTVTTVEAKRLGLNIRGASVAVEQACGDRKAFRVRDPQPDGSGMTIIVLDAEP